MGKPKHDKSLTHEEIWDDSALVQSWDEAVEEYKLYHSIHAKGENVEDVLREAEAAGLSEQDVVLEGGEVVADDAMETDTKQTDAQLDQTAANFEQATQPPGHPPQHSAEEGSGPAAGPASTFPAGAMPMPEAVLPHIQDEGLKRLMMSWYFAGYYTGLYQGQQQASQAKS
ncbi:uncharacterized protein N7482_002267 [Penicillium canariense]|uniref:Survival Motor Neuron Gemin2-binding domain-containing protein n=1 Tax=Penicillium canariense TaxID=189055 RepID=A0A9W9LUB7_9EURO|nr:uncharacterized protein N7482_002267 [Penicillium canariense]KAJ5176390.1 hypothetical protein N7482_002267 [Penicillium canariense]